MLPLEDGNITLPSAVFFNADENAVAYGRAALAGYLSGDEGRLMRSLKSLLGSSLIDGHTEVHGRRLPFRELLTQFIGELRRRAESCAGRPFEQAVFGRPVRFVDDDDAADREAEATLEAIAHKVGFREISFQLEPIGAALHYEQSLTTEEIALIADIGGGTADFSIARLSASRSRRADRTGDVLGNAGVHIGGTDFDRSLSLECLMPLLGYRTLMKSGATVPSSIYFQLATWHTINQAYARQSWAELQDVLRDAASRAEIERLRRLVVNREGHWLALQAEQAKINLSGAERTSIALDRIESGLTCDISREAFEAATRHLVERVVLCVRDLLRRTGTSAKKIRTIYFTGGASGIGHLRERISAELPSARCVEGDLYGSIGAGLALEAARRYG